MSTITSSPITPSPSTPVTIRCEPAVREERRRVWSLGLWGRGGGEVKEEKEEKEEEEEEGEEGEEGEEEEEEEGEGYLVVDDCDVFLSLL